MPQRVSVRVPATSANLGCAFDCAALALNLYLDLHLTPRKDGGATVRYHGVTPERVPTDSSNLVARTIQRTLVSWNQPGGFDLEIENQIPVGVGLGSSAAAIVSSLAACRELAGATLSDEELVSQASRIEGHPDNVAAAWHGGFTLAVQESDRVLSWTCPIPDSLELVVVVPDYALPTEKAREVLPALIPRPDAVHNLQRAAVMVAQVFSGKAEFLPLFFDDRWHQPYRATLAPGLKSVLGMKHPQLLGVCLSGAGPSVLAFARAEGMAVGEALRKALAEEGVRSRAYVLAADNRGAKGWRLPA